LKKKISREAAKAQREEGAKKKKGKEGIFPLLLSFASFLLLFAP
jgi:hypothetical protein